MGIQDKYGMYLAREIQRRAVEGDNPVYPSKDFDSREMIDVTPKEKSNENE